MAKKFHEEVKGEDNSEDIMIYLDENLITLHVGYYQSKLTQKGCKELIAKLKLAMKAANAT